MGGWISLARRKVEETKAHYLDSDEFLETNLERDLIIREIDHLTNKLIKEGPNLSLPEKEEAISRIGHMAYMGPPEAAKHASLGISTMVNLLKNKTTPKQIKVKVIGALSEICYLNRENQMRAMSSLPYLVQVMGDQEDIQTSRLACYTLTCLVCNNYAMLTALAETRGLIPSLTKCMNSERPWTGWTTNYSTLLVDILGVSNKIGHLNSMSFA